MPEVSPIWKEGPRKKKPRPLRAEPDRPMAPRCEASIRLVCSGRATHRHHVTRRSQGGGHGAENTLDLCFECHEHIHRNPDWSRSQGFLH
jgi:hypothetical protein